MYLPMDRTVKVIFTIEKNVWMWQDNQGFILSFFSLKFFFFNYVLRRSL